MNVFRKGVITDRRHFPSWLREMPDHVFEVDDLIGIYVNMHGLPYPDAEIVAEERAFRAWRRAAHPEGARTV